MSGAGIVKILINGLEEAAGPMARILDDADLMDGFMASLRDGDYAEFLARNGADDLLTNPTFARMMGNLSGNMDDVARLGTQLGDSSVATSQIVDDLAEIVGREFVTEGTEAALRTGVEGFRSSLGAFDASAQRIAEARYRATRLATHGADEVAETGADVANNLGPRLTNGEARFVRMDRAITYTTRAAAATAIGAAIIEVETGGALSQMTLEALVDAAEYAREHNLPFAEDLAQTAFEGVAYVYEVMHAGRTSVHNGAVSLALGDADEATPEDIARARATAISWQFTEPTGIAADAYLVSQRVKIENPDMPQDERDALVAEALMERLVENANVSALAGIGETITREDVEQYMRDHASEIAAMPDSMARIRTALVAAVPGLDTAVASAEPVAPAGAIYRAITGESTDAEVSDMFRLASLNMDSLNLDIGEQIKFGFHSMLATALSAIGGLVSIFNPEAGAGLMAMAANQQRIALTSTEVDERLAALPRDQVVTQGGDEFRVAETGPEAAPAAPDAVTAS